MTDLPLLISTLEEAGEGSRELDTEVWLEIGWNGQGDERPVPPLTTSVDAALALIGERLPGWCGPISLIIAGSAQAHIEARDPCDRRCAQAFGHTPALALCLALLKAINQGETHDA